MALQGQVIQAPAGLLGFDTDQPLNEIQARHYFNRGYRFCLRYVPHTAQADPRFTDITSAEAQGILDAGLGLMVVQHPPAPGWTPNMQKGQAFGKHAASHSGDAGIPAKVNVWLDLEGVKAGTPAQDVIDFCNAWFAEIARGSYEPGVYIGSSPGLSADELYWDLQVKHYWRAGSTNDPSVPNDIPHRGYQLIQRIANPGSPTEFDSDVTKTDNFGQGAFWVYNPVAAPVA